MHMCLFFARMNVRACVHVRMHVSLMHEHADTHVKVSAAMEAMLPSAPPPSAVLPLGSAGLAELSICAEAAA